MPSYDWNSISLKRRRSCISAQTSCGARSAVRASFCKLRIGER